MLDSHTKYTNSGAGEHRSPSFVALSRNCSRKTAEQEALEKKSHAQIVFNERF